MYYLLIEIYNLKQLGKLTPGLSEEIEAELASCLEARGGRRLPSEGGWFFHSFRAEDSRETVRLLDGVLSFRDFLLRRVEDLNGFLLFLDHRREKDAPERVYREMRAELLSSETENDLLFGSDAAPFFSGLCRCEEQGAFHRFIERNQGSLRRIGKARDFCILKKSTEEIKNLVSSRLDCRSGPDVLLLYGTADSGLSYQVDFVLRGLVDDGAVLTAAPRSGDRTVFAPFSGLFSGMEVEEIPEYLSAAEKQQWKEKKELVDFLLFGPRGGCLPDFPRREIHVALCLFMSSFCRRRGTILSPAVLFCQDFHAYNPETRALLSALMKDFLPGWGMIPVCTSTCPSLGYESRSLPVTRYRLPPLGEEDVRERLAAFGGEETGFSSFSLRERCRGRLVPLFHALQDQSGKAPDPSWSLLLDQGREFLEVLYVLGRGAPLLTADLLCDFLESLEVPREAVKEALKKAADLGFLRETKGFYLAFPGHLSRLETETSFRKDLIDQKFSLFLHQAWKKGNLHRTDLLFRLFAGGPHHGFTLELFHEFAVERIDAGDFGAARRLLYGAVPAETASDREMIEWREAELLSLRLRLALAEGEERRAEELFKAMNTTEFSLPQAGNPAWGEFLLQRARFLSFVKDFRGALAESKRAAMHLQDQRDVSGIVRANLQIGIAMLAQGHLMDALDYFQIAGEAAVQGGARLERLRSATFEAAAHFLLGNYSRTLELSETLAGEASRLFERRWFVLNGFMEARALFELGEYEKAEELLEKLLSVCAAAGLRAPVPVVRAWLGRCFVYRGAGDEGRHLLGSIAASDEALFFLAEEASFRGDHDRSVVLLSGLVARRPESASFYGDGFTWDDGYCFAENLALGRASGEDVLLRQAKAFLLSERAALGDLRTALHDMYGFLREEGISELDPNNRLYYFWYGRMLPESKDPVYEDRSTVLGKAVKYFQRRLASIENPAHKAAYSAKNRWNRLLLEEAKSLNLV